MQRILHEWCGHVTDHVTVTAVTLQELLVYRCALMCSQFPMLSAPSPPDGQSPTPPPPTLPSMFTTDTLEYSNTAPAGQVGDFTTGVWCVCVCYLSILVTPCARSPSLGVDPYFPPPSLCLSLLPSLPLSLSLFLSLSPSISLHTPGTYLIPLP